MEVHCRTGRGETNKSLDLIGQAPASHHRDTPREFYPVCGSREESPGARARKREGQRCAGSRSNRREWRWSHQQRQHLGSRGCSQAQERACSLYTARWQPQEWGLVWVPVYPQPSAVVIWSHWIHSECARSGEPPPHVATSTKFFNAGIPTEIRVNYLNYLMVVKSCARFL